jgi:Ferritin-like domain
VNKEQEQLDKVIAERRNFLKGVGFSGLGLAGATLIGSKLGLMDGMPSAKALGLHSNAVEASSFTDVDILNFALNLEYLEAEFYTVVVTGKTLDESGFDLSGTGSFGPTTGGKKVSFTGTLHTQLGMTFNSIMHDEQSHVKFLRAALGSAAVAKPEINLNALGIGFANVNQLIAVSRALEETGESAYAGAAHLITNKSYLTAAAQILAIESEHTGNMRLFCDLYNVPTAKIDWHDVLPPPTGWNLFTVDGNGLCPTRTTSEVLAIVYGSATSGTSRGGFFPKGVNGAINVV